MIVPVSAGSARRGVAAIVGRHAGARRLLAIGEPRIARGLAGYRLLARIGLVSGLRTLLVGGLLLALLLPDAVVGMSHRSPLMKGSVQDIERQAADLLAVLVADENRELPVPHLGLLLQKPARDQIG